MEIRRFPEYEIQWISWDGSSQNYGYERPLTCLRYRRSTYWGSEPKSAQFGTFFGRGRYFRRKYTVINVRAVKYIFLSRADGVRTGSSWPANFSRTISIVTGLESARRADFRRVRTDFVQWKRHWTPNKPAGTTKSRRKLEFRTRSSGLFYQDCRRHLMARMKVYWRRREDYDPIWNISIPNSQIESGSRPLIGSSISGSSLNTLTCLGKTWLGYTRLM